MALLCLRPLDVHQPAPQLVPSRLRATGQHLLKRMLAGWQRYHSTWEAFRAELHAGGMNARGQDTFGTLLACADLLLYDTWDKERLRGTYEGELKPWSEILAASTVAEFEDKTENWLGCLSHMLSVTPDPWSHTHHVSAGRMLESYWHNTTDLDLSTIKRELGKVGLSLVKHGAVPRPNYLAVPNQGPLTRSLFAGSKWAGDVGCGVWAGALRQANDELFKTSAQRVNGVLFKCTLISLEALYGKGGLFAAERGEQ